MVVLSVPKRHSSLLVQLGVFLRLCFAATKSYDTMVFSHTRGGGRNANFLRLRGAVRVKNSNDALFIKIKEQIQIIRGGGRAPAGPPVSATESHCTS